METKLQNLFIIQANPAVHYVCGTRRLHINDDADFTRENKSNDEKHKNSRN